MNETPTPEKGTSVVGWAREHGTAMGWHTALDNYEPCPRNWASGTLYKATDHAGREIVVLDGADQLKRNGTNACYLIDNGRTVRPMYVASYSAKWQEQTYVLLHDFPTNYNDDGTPTTRPDGRPVDFGSWQLGPRLTYHIKVQ